MKWVVDSTGRFRWRPYYQQAELDTECERITAGFLTGKCGAVKFPLSTDDLTVMIERDTSDLDLYADLSGEGEDVEGLTDFFPGKKPVVKISRALSLGAESHHRLRTTLAHEYGHVKFHNFLWSAGPGGQPEKDFWKKLSRQRGKYGRLRAKFESENGIAGVQPDRQGSQKTPVNPSHGTGPRCRYTNIIDAPVSDWMEWQAGYAGGALLMPVTRMREIAGNPDDALTLIDRVAGAFDVSAECARVRLLKLGFIPEILQEESEKQTVLH